MNTIKKQIEKSKKIDSTNTFIFDNTFGNFVRDPLKNEVYKGVKITWYDPSKGGEMIFKATKFTTKNYGYYYTNKCWGLVDHMAKIPGIAWSTEGNLWVVPLEHENKADKIIDEVLGSENEHWMTTKECQNKCQYECDAWADKCHKEYCGE